MFILPKKRIVLVYILSGPKRSSYGGLGNGCFVGCHRGVRASVVPLTPEVRLWCILLDLDYFDMGTPYGDTLQS